MRADQYVTGLVFSKEEDKTKVCYPLKRLTKIAADYTLIFFSFIFRRK